MTQPHHDAQAALHSLRAARAALDVQIVIAQRERGLALTDTADGLRSQIYGSRGGSGRPGDPTASAALNGTADARTSADLTRRYEHLAAGCTATLVWLAATLGADGPGDPLDRLAAAVPALQPSTAGQLALWVADEDRRIRRALGLPPDDYRTAEQLAARLTTDARPISAARIRDWARRSRTPGDRLHGMLPGVHTPGERTGQTWYRLADAQRVLEATKPQATQQLDEMVA